MSTTTHHAIIVSSWDENRLAAAHRHALEIFPCVSSIQASRVNGTQSFFIPPDGSKDGWPQSDDGDRERRAFLDYMEAQRYECGSSALDWVEVAYGECKPAITACDWRPAGTEGVSDGA